LATSYDWSIAPGKRGTRPSEVLLHISGDATLVPLGRPEKAMGHESPIEPWLAPDDRAAWLVSERTGFVAPRRWKPLAEKTISAARTQQRPEIRERKAKTILLHGVGWTARKNPAAGKLFFSW